MGQPKALVRDPDGTSWLNRAVDAAAAGGCNPVVVVLGAEADRAVDILNERPEADPPVRWVQATDWSEGMGASLRRGLEAATDTPATTAVVIVVDKHEDVRAALDTLFRSGRVISPGGWPVLR